MKTSIDEELPRGRPGPTATPVRIGMQTWGSEGDVQPFLALAKGAAEAGHEVVLSIASARDAEYEAEHERLTIERIPGEVSEREGAALIERIVATKSPLKQFELVLEEAFAPHVDALDVAARSLAARCDVLVRHHFLFMARAAAEAEGIPELSVFLTPDLLPTRRHPPTGMPSLGPLQGLGWWMMRKGVGSVLLPHARRYARRTGQATPRDVLHDVWCSPHGNLVAVSPALFPRPDDWPQTHHLTGLWRSPRSSQGELDPGLAAFLDAGPPPIYAGFGSMTPHGPAAQEATLESWRAAAARVDRRLIAQLPDVRPQEGEDVLVVPRSPHGLVFPRCAAVVHHGGAGTTQTAVRAGVPQVVVPHLADQFFWATQVARLGVGAGTASGVALSSERLATVLSAVVDDPTLRERASTVGAELEAEDGVAAALSVIA